MQDEVKLCYAHFPVGTIFEVSDMIAAMYDGQKEFEVKRIFRTGPDLYVLETTSEKNSKVVVKPMRDKEGEVSFLTQIEKHQISINIQHAVRVIKRGTGSYLPLGGKYTYDGDALRVPKGKGSYSSFFNFNDKVRQISSRFTRDDVCIDSDALSSFIEKRAAIRTKLGNNESNKFPVCFIRKKKLKRIIKQNINRFLRSPKEVQKEYDSYPDTCDYSACKFLDSDDSFDSESDTSSQCNVSDSTTSALDDRFAIDSIDFLDCEQLIRAIRSSNKI